jgi:hypothetical protein
MAISEDVCESAWNKGSDATLAERFAMRSGSGFVTSSHGKPWKFRHACLC